MDTTINGALLKTLREKNAWSQDQLAQAASMDSRAAIAVVFNMEAEHLCEALVSPTDKRFVKGLAWGVGGHIVGLVCAYVGITFALLEGDILPSEAGIYYGSIGAFCGAGCAILGVWSEKLKMNSGVRIK